MSRALAPGDARGTEPLDAAHGRLGEGRWSAKGLVLNRGETALQLRGSLQPQAAGADGHP
jgi:hypothetical protein